MGIHVSAGAPAEHAAGTVTRSPGPWPSQLYAPARRTARPAARWRGGRGLAVLLAVLALAGTAAGRPAPAAAAAGGSVTACAQFGAGAIQRQATVTTAPAACQGLSGTEVNVAIGRALRAATAGERGKARQRHRIAQDSRYLAGLIRAARTPAQPAAPLSGPASRAGLSLAALAAWLVTVGLGVSMMARWVIRARRRPAGPVRRRPAPVLNVAHFGLAAVSLLAWIAYLATGVTGLAWAACALLLPVAGVGMTLVFLPPARSPAGFPATADARPATLVAAGRAPVPASAPALARTAVADPSGDAPVRRPPALVVAAHIAAASLTILLAVLAAIGSG